MEVNTSPIIRVKVSQVRPNLTGRWILNRQCNVKVPMKVIIHGITRMATAFIDNGYRVTSDCGLMYEARVINEGNYALQIDVYETRRNV